MYEKSRIRERLHVACTAQKETYTHMNRDLHIDEMRPHKYEKRLIRKRPYVSCIYAHFVKRDLHTYEKRPTQIREETMTYMKRNL